MILSECNTGRGDSGAYVVLHPAQPPEHLAYEITTDNR